MVEKEFVHRISLKEAVHRGLYKKHLPVPPYPTKQKTVRVRTRYSPYIRRIYQTIHVKKTKRRRAYTYKKLIREVHVRGHSRIDIYKFDVPVPKPVSRWAPLKNVIERLRRSYQIKRGHTEWPHTFLKWAHLEKPTGLHFWSWVRREPPYAADMYVYIKVEVWYVVYDEEEEEFFLRASSRVRGMDLNGEDWAKVIQVRDQLMQDVEKFVDAKDYLEFTAWAGFSAYPEANWYLKYNKAMWQKMHSPGEVYPYD